MIDEQKMFVVAIDVLAPTFDPDAMKTVLKNSRLVTGWWNHIPGCFLITSNADANRITDEVRTATGDARLLVMEVKPGASEGWLPSKSWEWLRRREAKYAH